MYRISRAAVPEKLVDTFIKIDDYRTLTTYAIAQSYVVYLELFECGLVYVAPTSDGSALQKALMTP